MPINNPISRKLIKRTRRQAIYGKLRGIFQTRPNNNVDVCKIKIQYNFAKRKQT
jgi:hypothetical protein